MAAFTCWCTGGCYLDLLFGKNFTKLEPKDIRGLFIKGHKMGGSEISQ